ncbi:MAG TPA: XrtA/PEP-CTERM system histidine kinase PrsK [Gammaproteobacteria bacterium]|nr:XrtA/PEP-CTERM system histidine kinase PrsK [Gammaproteobacteria bacterium]
MNLGVVSYVTGASFFVVLSLLLLTGRHGRPQKTLLLVASLAMVLWAASAAYAEAHSDSLYVPHLLELVRDFAWIAFLVRILAAAQRDADLEWSWFRSAVGVAGAFTLMLSALATYRYLKGSPVVAAGGVDLLIAGYLALSVAGLVLVEQLIRNIRADSRRAIKYLCYGIGGLFAYDFYMYANALLFQRIDPSLWAARGFINALVVPVIGVSVSRDPKWSLDIFVSRRIVFHTVSLLGAGLYLLAIGAGGYYVRVYGGSWGAVAQTIFLFGAGLLLVILLFSGQLRANLRVLISKHFFHYKYDYRDEWLRFIRTLSTSDPVTDLRERAIRAIAEIVDSPGGVLWMRRDHGRFEPVTRWNMTEDLPDSEPGDSSLVRFLDSQEWVINLDEYERDPDLYADLALPRWLRFMERAWLVAPLILHERLLGFVLIARSPVRSHFNWEDCDLLKTAGREAASHLAQLEASQALVDARQFEACSRLTAYVMHDLKNLIAQLSLVVTNASRHKHNPQFMEDAISTVDNSVAKMNRLMQKLRSGGRTDRELEPIELCALLKETVKTMSGGAPVPSLDCQVAGATVRAEADGLAAVVGHVIRNAQEATPDDGSVMVRLFRSNDTAVIEIQDTGCGMDEEFIRERLFRPFDSTKGGSGMGIGAYETREFVRGLGGEVEVLSRVDEGSTFRLRIPISDDDKNDVKLAAAGGARYADDGEYQEIAGG